MNGFSPAVSGKVFSESSQSNNKGKTESLSAIWDFIIITASNEFQASGYQKHIEYRVEKGFLPRETVYAVLPDREGKRIGSGGAAFNVLRHIREISDEEDSFTGKHILVIHSGGDSMRVPQYSACGKLFSPVQRELSAGISATLFDEIIMSVAGLPSKIPAGMLTLTGDILIGFNPGQVELDGCYAAAISVSENIRTGRNHGVFIPDEEGNVKEFMHKALVDDLRESGAEDNNGNVHLDTGAIWFGVDVVKGLLKLISTGGKIDEDKFEQFVNEKARLSFYADFVYPMARDSSLEQFYTEKSEGGFNDELTGCRTALWDVLHRYPMKLIALSPALFIHFGTTAELLKMRTSDIQKYASLGWKYAVNTNMAASGRFSANNSFADEKTVIGDGSYIENSSIYSSKVGKNCIVSNITLDKAEIPDNTVVHCLKQNDGDYVVRIYGIQDDPKLGVDDGGTFFGIPIRDFLYKHRLKVADLWDSEPHSLWNAKLYCKNCSMRQSLVYALSLCTDSAQPCEIGRRVSLKQSYENAHVAEIVIKRADFTE